MLVATIAVTLGGFAAGAYATYRYAPTLAQEPGSVAIGLVICALAGAACALAAMHVYLAIHDFVDAGSVGRAAIGSDVVGGAISEPSRDAETLANAALAIAVQSGVLAALAATVFVLGRPHRREAT